MQAFIEQDFQVPFTYRVFFTSSLFSPGNRVFSDFLDSMRSKGLQQQLLFVIDEAVYDEHPKLGQHIEAYCDSLEGFNRVPILIIPGGEAAKNDPGSLERIIHAVEEFRIDRHSYLVAIGGGSLLDLAGYAAAIAHRGVRHIRIPTTVLSQNDSGVGVKNGINYKGKKNFLGTFAPPVAVFNDINFLNTLQTRDWSAGMAEAVKVALIKDAAFFTWMEQAAHALSGRDMEVMQELIYRCAELHMQHIGGGGDPFEKGSSRPLDFGHWSAHKLEPLTNFELRHGEAVSIGIALDSVYSCALGWISEADMTRIVDLLVNLGLPVYHPLLDPQGGESPVVKGLEEFREHLGGVLTITLLRSIGKGEEVHEMDLNLLQQSASRLKKMAAAKYPRRFSYPAGS